MTELLRVLRGILRLTLYLVWCAIGIPLQSIVLKCTRGPASLVIPYYWHKATCRIFGIRVEMVGEPVKNRQVVLVCNHLSYLDIETISSLAPWSFVAKAEVAKWPLLGTLARLQQTAFTSRSRTDAIKDRDALSSLLAAGKNLILFAEGTSSGGADVLPFKSSLLAAVMAAPLKSFPTVQPVTIAIIEVDGRPADTQMVRDLYAWYADMTLAPHLWRFACGGGARLRVIFHPAIAIDATSDRKEVARACHETVAWGMKDIFSAMGWHPCADMIKVQPSKEIDHDVFVPRNKPRTNISADEVR